MSILSLFYRWAMDEGFATAEPFTYRSARAVFAGTGREVRVNLAVRRTPKPHVTIKYLEPDFTDLFRKGLRGLAPDGNRDTGFAGREMTRNAAIGDLALATGLRLGEFTHLLPWEIPALPPAPTAIPIPFPVPAGITKGRKFRTTWISYDALAGLHDYLQLDRAAVTDGSAWRPPRRWGEPLQVTDPDARGGRINGVRRSWESLTPAERRRLVAPEGGSCLLAVKADGGPFTAWATVFERTADRIRARFEPRFPHVHPHRLRHSLLDADPGISGDRLLPAGSEAGARHRRRRGAGVLPDQGRPAAGAAGPARTFDRADHREIPATPGYNTDLPASLRKRRSGSSAHRGYRRAEREADAEFDDDAERGGADADDGRRRPARHLSCVFSDGSRAEFDLDGICRTRRLARDLAVGLVELIHPHGSADTGWLGRPLRAWVRTGWCGHSPIRVSPAAPAICGAGQLAQFWMAGPDWLEALTRCMVEGYARSGGRLGEGVLELAAGRHFNIQPQPAAAAALLRRPNGTG